MEIGKMTIDTNEYRTKDLGEAAALLCRSVRLLRLEKENTFYWFVFANKKVCQELSDEYWFGELVVNAKNYQNSLKTLKDRLFAQK